MHYAEVDSVEIYWCELEDGALELVAVDGMAQAECPVELWTWAKGQTHKAVKL